MKEIKFVKTGVNKEQLFFLATIFLAATLQVLLVFEAISFNEIVPDKYIIAAMQLYIGFSFGKGIFYTNLVTWNDKWIEIKLNSRFEKQLFRYHEIRNIDFGATSLMITTADQKNYFYDLSEVSSDSVRKLNSILSGFKNFL
jgi:hypothetical protein